MIRRAAAIGFLACLALAPAWAEGKLEPPDLERYLRWGPLRVRPGFEISNLGYDSNIFFATGEEEAVSDYTATLSPKVDGLVLFGDRAFLNFRERLDYTLYFDNSDQNFLNQRGRARLTVPFRRFGFFSDIRLDNVKERRPDREDIRPERRERLLGIGAIFQPGWRTEIELGFSTTDFSFVNPETGDTETPVADLLDRREDSTGLEVSYRILGRTHLLFDASTKRVDFDQVLAQADRDTDEWRLLGGLDFGEGGTLSGTAKLGWARIDSIDAGLPDLSEWVGEAEVSYRVTTRTRLLLEARRLPGFAIYRPEGEEEFTSHFLNTQYGLRAVHYLNRLVGVEGSMNRGRLTFPESGVGADRMDRLRRYDVGVRLRMFQNSLGRRVEYSIRVGRYRRDSSDSDFDQAQNTFNVGAVLGY